MRLERRLSSSSLQMISTSIERFSLVICLHRFADDVTVFRKEGGFDSHDAEKPFAADLRQERAFSNALSRPRGPFC